MKFGTVLFFTFVSLHAGAKVIEIKMKNSGADGSMVFEPGFVQASVGDTIQFIPTDVSHNSSSVVVPSGAKPWTGKADKAVSVKLEKEGVYLFKCDPHAIMAMVGVVQVGKPTNLADVKKAADQLTSTFVMSKDRLTKYLTQVK